MSLPGDLVERLEAALLDAFPDDDALDRLIRRVGMQARVPGRAALDARVGKLVEAVDAQGRVLDLLETALDHAPGNVLLADARPPIVAHLKQIRPAERARRSSRTGVSHSLMWIGNTFAGLVFTAWAGLAVYSKWIEDLWRGALVSGGLAALFYIASRICKRISTDNIYRYVFIFVILAVLSVCSVLCLTSRFFGHPLEWRKKMPLEKLIVTNGPGAMLRPEQRWVEAFTVCVQDPDGQSRPGLRVLWSDRRCPRSFVGFTNIQGCVSATQLCLGLGVHEIGVALVAENWDGPQFQEGEVPTRGDRVAIRYQQY